MKLFLFQCPTSRRRGLGKEALEGRAGRGGWGGGRGRIVGRAGRGEEGSGCARDSQPERQGGCPEKAPLSASQKAAGGGSLCRGLQSPRRATPRAVSTRRSPNESLSLTDLSHVCVCAVHVCAVRAHAVHVYAHAVRMCAHVHTFRTHRHTH